MMSSRKRNGAKPTGDEAELLVALDALEESGKYQDSVIRQKIMTGRPYVYAARLHVQIDNDGKFRSVVREDRFGRLDDVLDLARAVGPTIRGRGLERFGFDAYRDFIDDIRSKSTRPGRRLTGEGDPWPKSMVSGKPGRTTYFAHTPNKTWSRSTESSEARYWSSPARSGREEQVCQHEDCHWWPASDRRWDVLYVKPVGDMPDDAAQVFMESMLRRHGFELAAARNPRPPVKKSFSMRPEPGAYRLVERRRTRHGIIETDEPLTYIEHVESGGPTKPTLVHVESKTGNLWVEASDLREVPTMFALTPARPETSIERQRREADQRGRAARTVTSQAAQQKMFDDEGDPKQGKLFNPHSRTRCDTGKAMGTKKPIITYVYRGEVERGTGRGYKWHRGYSESTADGHVVYPWMTKREAQQEARDRGASARFDESSPTNVPARNPAKVPLQPGDLVRRTGKFLRSIGMFTDRAINGLFVGQTGSSAIVLWSDAAIPSFIHPANLEIDKRGMGMSTPEYRAALVEEVLREYGPREKIAENIVAAQDAFYAAQQAKKPKRNGYEGDAVAIARDRRAVEKYRAAKEKWNQSGRRGPPPLPPAVGARGQDLSSAARVGRGAQAEARATGNPAKSPGQRLYERWSVGQKPPTRWSQADQETKAMFESWARDPSVMSPQGGADTGWIPDGAPVQMRFYTSANPHPITNDQIEALREEAATAGDVTQMRICDDALAGNEKARLECAGVIRRASAMDDEVYHWHVVSDVSGDKTGFGGSVHGHGTIVDYIGKGRRLSSTEQSAQASALARGPSFRAFGSVKRHDVGSRPWMDGIVLRPSHPNPSRVVSLGERGQLCALPGSLPSKERYALPDWAFGLEGEPRSDRKYPLFVMMRGGKIVPSKTHAITAKGRAKQQLDAGNLTRAQYDTIVEKANRVIAMCKAAPTRGPSKAAANPTKAKLMR